jgi:glucose-6-phosphate isomerase
MKVELVNFNRFQEKMETGLNHLLKEDFLNRLLKKDFTLWKDQDQEITNRLGWLESPLRMQDFLADYQKESQELEEEGIKHVVLLGMGGSSLAPKTISDLLPAPGGRQLTMLDSTCPEEILKVAHLTDKQAGETMFVVSSKSGTTTETLCFLNFFYARQKEILGHKAGRYFVAITDPGTPLEKIARSLGFRKIIPGFPEVGGRFSALSPFGLFPVGLLGLDLEKFLTPAVKSYLHLKSGDYHHAGLRLGLALGKLAGEGVNKLTLLLPSGWKSFGRWLEQLIAESTGKEGQGVVPVVETMPVSAENYSQDRVFVLYRSGEQVDVFQAERKQRASEHHPLIHITGQEEELAEHFYAWEVATAVIGHFLGLNPFDQPDVELTKIKTKKLLKTGLADQPAEDFKQTNQEETLSELVSFLTDSRRSADYFSLLCFLPPEPNLEVALDNFSRLITEKTGRPCLWNYGPAYLHSTGQLFKGDAGRGKFIGLYYSEAQTIKIPDLPESPAPAPSFNQLFQAQALADLQALQEKKRDVLFLKLSASPVKEIFQLSELIRE